MADINEAINCVQNLIIAMSCYGSTCENERNSEVGRLENVLDCLTEERKSADEMLRNLGYHLDTSLDGAEIYVDSDELIEIRNRPGELTKETCFGEPIDFTPEEILALARMIEEEQK